jgi:GNAT superfamily N-acetyltransferase
MMSTNEGAPFMIRPMLAEDIEDVRRVGQITWSEVASRETGKRIRYPVRPRKVIEAYSWSDPQGCLVAEKEGEIVGSIFSHVWGRVGWIGPFEVLPELQSKGVGKALFAAAEGHLLLRGCAITGLETMTHVPRNVQFYMRAGYAPGDLALISTKALGPAAGSDHLEGVGRGELDELLAWSKTVSSAINPYLDYSSEIVMALEKDLGPVFVLRKEARIKALAVVHAYHPLAEADHSSVRLLLMPPNDNDEGAFRELMAGIEHRMFEMGRRRLFARFQSSKVQMFNLLADLDYKVEGANVRMSKPRDYAEKGEFNMAAWAG